MRTPKRSLDSVSSVEVEAAISEAQALEQVRRSKPSVEDYVAEGVLSHMPEENAEGQVDARIEGHDRVVRALQMNEEFRRKEAEHFDSRRESPVRSVYREAKDEARARKFHRPRVGIVHPGLPWKKEA